MTTYFVKKRHQYSHLCEGEKLCKKTQGAKVEKSGAERPQADIPYKYTDPVGGRDPHNNYIPLIYLRGCQSPAASVSFLTAFAHDYISSVANGSLVIAARFER